MEEVLKKRILVLTERYSPENFLINDLVEHWRAEGYSISVLTQIPSYPSDRLFPAYPNRNTSTLEKTIRVRRFKTVLGYKRNLFRKAFGYVAFMFRACWYSLYEIPRHDIVFVYHTGPLTQALPLVLAKQIFKKRTVIWTQDVWPDTVFAYGFPERGAFAVLLKKFVRLVYRSCDQVCVSSEGFLERVRPYLNKGALATFVPQWVPEIFMSTKSAPFNFTSRGIRFIFTGNLGTMQNLEIIIQAFSQFKPEDAHLYILGDGSRRQALEMLSNELQGKNISFLGSIPQDQVLSCIQQCDFALLSLRDDPVINLTVPAKFQSYLAAERPILAVCNGEARALVEMTVLGETADPFDLVDITKAIQRCLDLSDNKYETYAGNMRELLETRYNKKTILQHFDRVLCGS
jgi:glycosyltransferase involved in cell wall biosynthesis